MMKIICFVALVCLSTACGDSFLDAKPDKALVIPETLDDLQALLDDVNQQINQTPGFVEFATDDFVAAAGSLDNLREDVRNVYLWNRDFEYLRNSDWDRIYHQILRVNVVLETLEKINGEDIDRERYDDIKGTALFFRAWHHFHLLQTFSVPYDPSTSSRDAGIVMRLSADVNERLYISRIEDCYKQIISDLENAIDLLPKITSVTSRPRLATATALLSRILLSKFDYANAETYADFTLDEYDVMLDYNHVDMASGFSEPLYENGEVLLYSIPILYTTAIFQSAAVNPDLYDLYDDADLRKSLFFKEGPSGIPLVNHTFYASGATPFTGITTGEVFLIKAEALARRGETVECMQLLNTLRERRWDQDEPYVAQHAEDAEAALSLVLKERRRELVLKGLRWYDLRRLNKDARFAETLQRSYNGEQYKLYPDDEFYSFPIPISEIKANPDLNMHK